MILKTKKKKTKIKNTTKKENQIKRREYSIFLNIRFQERRGYKRIGKLNFGNLLFLAERRNSEPIHTHLYTA